MDHRRFDSLPGPIQRQLATLRRGLTERLSENLIGIYLHGSLAMGCFHPAHSDIDLMVTVRQALSTGSKRRVIDLLLEVSTNPAPVEISLLTTGNLLPWRYPTPYDLHYGEDWRQRLETDLAGGAWRRWNSTDATDPDLAAHITVLQERGITLLGPEISRMFPEVPREHYLDSILSDYRWARERIQQNPVYGVLSMTRVLLYLRENLVGSKAEAGSWAVGAFPEESRSIIQAALERYLEADDGREIQPDALQRFVETADAQVTSLSSVEMPGPDSPGSD